VIAGVERSKLDQLFYEKKQAYTMTATLTSNLRLHFRRFGIDCIKTRSAHSQHIGLQLSMQRLHLRRSNLHEHHERKVPSEQLSPRFSHISTVFSDDACDVGDYSGAVYAYGV